MALPSPSNSHAPLVPLENPSSMKHPGNVIERTQPLPLQSHEDKDPCIFSPHTNKNVPPVCCIFLSFFQILFSCHVAIAIAG